ncbi:MAG: hypothetical protein ACYC9K_00860 [Sulfuricaulis sp.]
MANKKSTLGDIPSNVDNQMREFLGGVKNNIEQITGRGHGAKPIATLASSATTAQIIGKINEIIAQING